MTTVNAQIRDLVLNMNQEDPAQIVKILKHKTFEVGSNELVSRLSQFRLDTETLNRVLESKPVTLSRYEYLGHHTTCILQVKKAINGDRIPIAGDPIQGSRADVSDGQDTRSYKISKITPEEIVLSESVTLSEGSTICIRRNDGPVMKIMTTCTGCEHLKEVPVFSGGTGVCQCCYTEIRKKQQKMLSYIEGERIHSSYFTLSHREPLVLPESAISKPHNGYQFVACENAGEKSILIFEHEETKDRKSMRFINGKLIEQIDSKRISYQEADRLGVKPKIVNGKRVKNEKGQDVFSILNEDFVLIQPKYLSGLLRRSDVVSMRVKRKKTPAKYFAGKFVDMNTRGDKTLEHMIKVFNVSRSIKYIEELPDNSIDAVHELYDMFISLGNGQRSGMCSNVQFAAAHKKIMSMAGKLLHDSPPLEEKWVSKLIAMHRSIVMFLEMSGNE